MRREIELEQPLSVGVYTLLARIGGGGHASVYAAAGPLGRVCAVKVLDGPSERHFEALEREYQILGWLDHPALIDALDIGVHDDGRGWIALELVEGRTARDWVQRSWYRAGRSLHVAAQVVDALVDLGRRGLVHGDLKPSNLMVDRTGQVRILDLGLARWTAEEWIPAGRFAGTPMYASPEQLRGAPLTPASDVFSLAATVYALATGRSPFPRDLYATRDGQAPEPLEDVTPTVAQALLAALSPDPADRPSAEELAAVLADATASSSAFEDDPPPAPPALSTALRPAHEQFQAILAIAGDRVELAVLAEALGEAPAVLADLARDLERAGHASEHDGSWWSSAEPPAPAPWNLALADALCAALDPGPSLARAHALLHLGRVDEAEVLAVSAGLVSERLVAASDAIAARGHEALRGADVTQVAGRSADVWAALDPSGPSALARGFQAAAAGDGAGALALAAEAQAAGADPDVCALLRARALPLRGRHSEALRLLRRSVRGDLEALVGSLLRIEIAALHHRFGRLKLARAWLARVESTLPRHPPAGLLGRWVRVSGEIAAALGTPVDLDAVSKARRLVPPAGDGQVLAALEALATRDEPQSVRHRDALAAVTPDGPAALPDLASALALSIRATGTLPSLPDTLRAWLESPGAAAWRLQIAAAAMTVRPGEVLRAQALDAARVLLPCLGSANARVFRLQPWWRDVEEKNAPSAP